MGMHSEKAGPLWWGPSYRGLQEKDGKKGREMLDFHFTHTTCINRNKQVLKKPSGETSGAGQVG